MGLTRASWHDISHLAWELRLERSQCLGVRSKALAPAPASVYVPAEREALLQAAHDGGIAPNAVCDEQS